jgi:hypothetical protein
MKDKGRDDAFKIPRFFSKKYKFSKGQYFFNK